MTITITKRDGSRVPFNADKINKSIERACYGLTDPISKVIQIATETRLTLYDGITTEELDAATINAALQNAQFGLEFDKIATRLLLKDIYKKVLGDYDNEESRVITNEEFAKLHSNHFKEYILDAVEKGLLDKRMISNFDLEELASNLKIENDELYKYSGLSTMLNRYLIKKQNQNPLETPQYFWMRIAMGMSLNEKDPTEWAKKFYDKMSRLEYLSAGSSNIGAGTPHPKLSNCFLMEMHDDMEHIGKTVSDVLLLSKATGGIGLSVTKLRAEGSILKSNNTISSGPVPFMHIVDSAIRAVQRGGKKKGALCFYMENWHLNFQDFLDLKQNNGDDYRRTRTANTAVFISDEFMKRVLEGADWYLFDPNEVKDLNELYGKDFSKRYNEYVEMAKAGKMKMFKVMPAREQYLPGRFPLEAGIAFSPATNNFHPEFVERRIWSGFHRFAGTIDAIASIGDKFGVLDIKTSTGFFPEYNLQTAAYVLALQEVGVKRALALPRDIETRWILRIDQNRTCNQCGSRLREKGGRAKIRAGKSNGTTQCAEDQHDWGATKGEIEIKEFPYFYRDIKAFLAAKTLWEWEHDYWLKQIGYLR